MSAAEDVFAGLTDAQKIGQVISTSVGHHSSVMVDPPVPEDPAADAFWAAHAEAMRRDRARVTELVEAYALGGVCYFPGRLDGSRPDEVVATIRELGSAAELPLLVSTDQEGGRVARLRGGFTLFGSAMSMAATGDPAAVAAAAYVTGTELRAVGIQQVFSPVCDLNLNPANPVIGTRSYGATAADAAPYLRAVVEGFARADVATTAKHFPGHGDTATDSHLAVPVLTHDLGDWRAGEGASFAAAIAAGVDAVMTGHLVLQAVDPRPATYAGPVLTGLLREELGFDGLVVTDALGMSGAVGDLVDALNAGADQLLMPPDVPAAVAQLIRALDDGRLPVERLGEACLRVLRLKERLGLLPGQPSYVGPGREVLGQHQADAIALAASAVTVRGSRPAPVARRVALRGGSESVRSRLAGALAEVGVTVAADAGPTVVLVGDAPPVGVGPDDVLVVTGLPYVAAGLGAERPVLLTYGDNATHLAAVARVLCDPDLARGRLPVPLS
ncbi:MAG: glycoside hydrolase family 3 protein [Propionibacteriaceae bacterium]